MSFKDFKNKLQQRNPSDLSSAYADKSYEDDRFWKLHAPTGKGEEATAIIRFLPQKDPDKTSFFRYYHFSFKEETTGLYYIENCLNTFGDNVKDPCSEENRRLWNMIPPSGADPEFYKNICRQRKRKIGYIANILVVKDKKSPQNEGKVFLFKFGVKILDKINLVAAGNAELGEQAFDPTDFDNGANFALIMHKDESSGFFQYEKSKFGKQSSIGDDEYQEAIYNQLYDLDTALTFKSYQELSERFDLVLGRTSTPVPPDESQHIQEAFEGNVLPTPTPMAVPSAKVSPVSITPTPAVSIESNKSSVATDDDDEFLNQLLGDDLPF